MANSLLRVAAMKKGGCGGKLKPSDEFRKRRAGRLKRQANDLSAALTPEKLVKVVSEQETNLLRVFAHLNCRKFLHINHQAKPIVFGHDILETCVKVFDNRRARNRLRREGLASTPSLKQTVAHSQLLNHARLCVHVNSHPWPRRLDPLRLQCLPAGESTGEVLMPI